MSKHSEVKRTRRDLLIVLWTALCVKSKPERDTFVAEIMVESKRFVKEVFREGVIVQENPSGTAGLDVDKGGHVHENVK